jgi:hypothetical protein
LLQDNINHLVKELEGVSPAVQVLMVARTESWVMPGTIKFMLTPLSEKDAVQLLRHSCPNMEHLSHDEALKVVRHCDRNAAMLRFVGGVFNRRGDKSKQVRRC